jgi:hypothetical protein
VILVDSRNVSVADTGDRLLVCFSLSLVQLMIFNHKQNGKRSILANDLLYQQQKRFWNQQESPRLAANYRHNPFPQTSADKFVYRDVIDGTVRHITLSLSSQT